MTTHLCFARDCKKTCTREKLMCVAHWRLVPPHIQRAVYKSYRLGQGVGPDDTKPSPEWMEAVEAAVQAVIRTEAAVPREQTSLFAQLGEPDSKKENMH